MKENILKSFLMISCCANAYFLGSDDPKIIGGNVIDIKKVSFQVSLQGLSRETGDYQHYCGGSIIGNRHILTAAHCLFGYPKELISVVVGTTQWNGDNGKRHFVKQYYTHPMYKELQGNDIAVITLETELVFNENTNKIDLNDDKHVPEDNQSCIVSGWGYTFPIRAPDFIPYWLLQSINLYPTELKMAEVKTISNEKCREVYSYMTLDTELCTLQWSEGACSGDSGGPLVNVNRTILMGIVSFGSGICGGYTNTPDGFTRVSNFTKWINEIVME